MKGYGILYSVSNKEEGINKEKNLDHRERSTHHSLLQKLLHETLSLAMRSLSFINNNI